MRKLLMYVFITLIVWIAIFDPPLISRFNIIHIIGVLSILYIIVHKVRLSKTIMNMYIFLMCMYLFLVIVLLINRREGFFTVNVIYWALDIIPFSLALSHFAKKHEISSKKIISIIIWAGLFESLLVILSFLVPSIHNFFIMLMQNAGYGADFLTTWSFRIYGFASNLQYSSGIALAVIALLAINEALFGRKKRYYIYSIVLAACGFINCRTSVVIFICGVILLAFVEKKRVIKVVLFIVVVAIVATVVIVVYGKLFSATQISWLRDGLYDILSIFSDKYSARYSTLDYFLDIENYRLPDNIGNFLLGTGDYIMINNPLGKCTDVGFINDFWLGGIIYFCATIFSYFWILKQMYLPERKKNARTFAIMLIFICTMVISNIKGILFSFNNISTLIIILSVLKIEGLLKENNPDEDLELENKKIAGKTYGQ